LVIGQRKNLISGPIPYNSFEGKGRCKRREDSLPPMVVRWMFFKPMKESPRRFIIVTTSSPGDITIIIPSDEGT